MTAAETLSMIRLFVAEQAEDEALWADTQSIEVAYIQQELRRLHRVIESGKYETPAHLD